MLSGNGTREFRLLHSGVVLSSESLGGRMAASDLWRQWRRIPLERKLAMFVAPVVVAVVVKLYTNATTGTAETGAARGC